MQARITVLSLHFCRLLPSCSNISWQTLQSIQYSTLTEVGTDSLICALIFHSETIAELFFPMLRRESLLRLLQLCTSACQHLSQDKLCVCNCIQSGHMRCLRLLTQLHNCRAMQDPIKSPNKQLTKNPVFLFSRIVCLLDFCRLLSRYILHQSIWRFYGDVIYMGLWHVNDAREPCLPSIFMNNCVRGAVEMEGGGGTVVRPPKVSRAQSLDGGAAEAWSSHACRHWPTCSSTLVTFPKRCHAAICIVNVQLPNFHLTKWLLFYRLQIVTVTISLAPYIDCSIEVKIRKSKKKIN